MVTHYGYCPSLRKKVDFEVSDVIDIPTSRGMKYQIKGNFEGRLCNTFCSATKAAELRSQVGSPQVFTVMEAEESQDNLAQATQEDDVPTIIGPSQMAYGQEGEAAEALPLAETVPIPIISAIDMTLQPIDDLSMPDVTIADMQETLDVPPTMDANFEIAEMQPEGDGSSIGNIAPMNPDAPLHAEEFDAEDDEVDSEEIERFQLNLTEPEFVMGAYMILIGKDSTPTQTIEDKKIAITELLNENYENKEFWTQVRNELGKETRIGSFRERKETKLQNVTERRYSWIRRGAGQLHTQDYRIRAKRNENGIYDIVNSWGVIGTANSELEVREGLWWSAEEFGAEESQENLGQATQEESVPTIIGPSQEAYGQEGEAAEALPIAETIPTSIISAVDMNIESNNPLSSFNGGDILSQMESNLGERPTIMADFAIRPNEPFGDGRSIGNIAPMNPDVPFASEDDDMKYPCGECYYCINGVEDCDGTYWEAETFDAETFSAQDIEEMSQVPPPVCFVEKIPPEVWANTTIEDQMHYARTKDEGVLDCPQCGISKADLRGQGGYCGTTDPEGEEYIQSRSCPYNKYFAPQHWIEEPKVISHITPNKIVLEPTLIAEMDMPPINQLKAGITQKLIPTFLFNRINDLLPQGVVGKQTPDGMNYELTYYAMDTDAVDELVDIEEGEYDFMFASEQYTGNVVKSARGFELQAESVSIITPNKRTINNYRIGDKKVRELDDGTLEQYEAQRIQYDYMVHREPSGTEVGADGKRITNPTGGRFTSADAETFEADYFRQGFNIEREGFSNRATYYITKGDNRINFDYDRRTDYGNRPDAKYYPYSYGGVGLSLQEHLETDFATLQDALNWCDEQISNGRKFNDWEENLGVESFEAPRWMSQAQKWNANHVVWASDSKLVRQALKEQFPEHKFGVSIINGQYIQVVVKSGERPTNLDGFREEVKNAAMQPLAEAYEDSPEELREKEIYVAAYDSDFEAESFEAKSKKYIRNPKYSCQVTGKNYRKAKLAHTMVKTPLQSTGYIATTPFEIYVCNGCGEPNCLKNLGAESFDAESKKKSSKASKTAEKAILTGASTGATMEIADALLAAESFGAESLGAETFEAEEWWDKINDEYDTHRGHVIEKEGVGLNKIWGTRDGEELFIFSQIPDYYTGTMYQKYPDENKKSYRKSFLSSLELNKKYAKEQLMAEIEENIGKGIWTIEPYMEWFSHNKKWFLKDTWWGKTEGFFHKRTLIDTENMTWEEITKTIDPFPHQDGASFNKPNESGWVATTTLTDLEKPLDFVLKMDSKKKAESFNVEFDDWADQEMKTHGGNISFKKWAKEEGKKHGDVPITDWAEHEEESHDERYGAEGLTHCWHCLNLFEGKNFYGTKGNRLKVFCGSECIYDAGYVELETDDADEYGAEEMCPSCKFSGKNNPIYADGLCVECIEQAEDEADELSQRYGAEDCEHFWEVARDGENYNRCLTCGGTNQGDGWLAENTPSTKMKPTLKSIGILLGLGAIAAVAAPENLRKMFKR